QKQQGTNRILIELPGVKDEDRVRKLLQGTAELEFWETYDNTEIYPLLENIDRTLASLQKADASSQKAPEADSSAVAADTTSRDEGTLAALKGEADSTQADTLTGGSDLAATNPLFAILIPSMQQ